MIYIKREDYEGIVAYAIQGLPVEVCGLLGGTIKEEEKRIEAVYYLTNLDACSDHFSMDPKEQFQAIRDMRKKGLQMIGNFHSHPESPSRPSGEDKRLAYDPGIRYLILSLQDRDKPVLNAFAVTNGTVVKEDIVII